MILVDVNLLIAATIREADDHEPARDWFAERLSGTPRVGLPWPVLTGFVRIAAQPRIWERPVPLTASLGIVRQWLARACVWTPEPGPAHAEVLERLLEGDHAPRLVTDAHLAAIAVEHGLVVCSRDRDFKRWEARGVRSVDPLG